MTADRENGCCVDRRYKSPRGCKPETCMSLPDGKTCSDCVHVPRCESFGYTPSVQARSCGFFPRRFLEPTP